MNEPPRGRTTFIAIAFLSFALASCGGSSKSPGASAAAPSRGAPASNSDGLDAGSGTKSAGGNDNATFGSLGGADAAPSAQTSVEGGTIGAGGPGVITGTIRDFKFWDGTSSTNPDFEDPPYGIDPSGNPLAGYTGPWDDPDIVSATLGSDGKPVYKSPNGAPDANGRVTLTTHGKAWFDMWFNDTPGFNLDVQLPLPLTQTPANGTVEYGYDSTTAGIPYGFMSGDGFFPIDDGTQYGSPSTMTFGNESLPITSNMDPEADPSASTHNYSFTFELHAVFTYTGGEVFDFRGDDDVFVFIDSALVINLGGVHGPETASVSVDSLGLTIGARYPLDFFSVERHVSGSNILFSTSLVLEPVPE